MEHRDIFDQYQSALAVILPGGNAQVAIDQIKTLSLPGMVCPSDPPDNAGPNLAYVVNRGRNGVNTNPALGVCFDLSRAGDSPVSINYINSHDGTSTTLLASESILTPAGYTSGGPVPSSPRLQLVAPNGSTVHYFRPASLWLDTANTTTLAWKTGNSTLDDATDCDSRAELSLGFEWSAFSINAASGLAQVTQVINSRHGGLMMSSFCDGHQQPIREDIDLNVFKHIMTPNSSAAVLAFPAPEGPVGILNEGKL